MTPVIQVEKLSKRYRLGVLGSGMLREDLSRWWAQKRGRPDPLRRVGATDASRLLGEELWALREVSLEVREGEVLGIVGRNGAGKSTLLKILSRITAPTSGRAVLRGRVGSLLEVGTGFHPELTGRENVYLNGTLLGMTKAEVDRKLDEIVDFAEMAPFIDTPVKRYSSGMTVRLAFAVAAHLEPEILIVDEVLAVGDAAFQRKSLGKLRSVSQGGRTVLFVSHNLGALSRLCTRAVWLHEGRQVASGDPHDIVRDYLAASSSADPEEESGDASGNFLRNISLEDRDGVPARLFDYSAGLQVRLRFDDLGDSRSHVLAIRVMTQDGVVVFTSWDSDSARGERPASGCALCRVPPRLLRPGRYMMVAMLVDRAHAQLSRLAEARMSFRVNAIGFEMNASRAGLIAPVLDWRFEPSDSVSESPT